MRPNIVIKTGSVYLGGPETTRYYVAGIRVPRWIWRIAYRALALSAPTR